MEPHIQIVTTTESRQDAEKIASLLMQEKLAGCVQIIGPISSIYRWKECIESAQEWQCVVKTRRDLYKDVEKAIKNVHPYEVPEIIAVPLVEGSRDYLDWLDSVLKGN